MDDRSGGGRISFLGRSFPASFDVRVVAMAPGCRRVYAEAEWRDALVVVERGEIELDCAMGARPRFVSGDVLFLVGIPLRALSNGGRSPP